MRQAGSIVNLDQAERFADFLRAEGILCSVDSCPDGYRIWIQSDDHVDAAKAELLRFLSDPNHERYRDAARRANTRFREERDRRIANRPKIVNLANHWSRPAAKNCPITFGLIVMSCFVGFMTQLDWKRDSPFLEQMWFSNDNTLGQILRGEVWRLVTPIFLHYKLPHLIFNMVSTAQFGILIESRKGTLKFLGMVLVMALISNFAQFLGSVGRFGGMSGVVYGLFGYVWIKGKLAPEDGLGLNEQVVTMMLIVYVLCLTGVIPGVANWAHSGGLLTGMAMATSDTLIRTYVRRK